MLRPSMSSHTSPSNITAHQKSNFTSEGRVRSGGNEKKYIKGKVELIFWLEGTSDGDEHH